MVANDAVLLLLFGAQLILVPVQVVLVVMGAKRRALRWIAAALAPVLGLLHLAYEALVGPEANIRVDLLLLYPALAVSAVVALVALVLALRARPSEERSA